MIQTHHLVYGYIYSVSVMAYKSSHQIDLSESREGVGAVKKPKIASLVPHVMRLPLKFLVSQILDEGCSLLMTCSQNI